MNKNLKGCPHLKFDRRDDRRMRKKLERGVGDVFARRWQNSPENSPTTNRNGKWIVPYYFSNDVPSWMRDMIDDYLSDFGTNTCVEARRVDYSEKKWTNRVKFAYLHDEEMVFNPFWRRQTDGM